VRAGVAHVCASCMRCARCAARSSSRYPEAVDPELHGVIESARDKNAEVIAENSLHGRKNALCKVCLCVLACRVCFVGVCRSGTPSVAGAHCLRLSDGERLLRAC
jgi:hypothetical protein